MKYFWILTGLLLSMACASGSGRMDTQSSVDFPLAKVKADVDLFLLTDDAAVESGVLERLRRMNVSHETIKSILRDNPSGKFAATGLQRGQKFEQGPSQYGYAVYAPESMQPGKSYPLAVVLHGAGSTGDAIIETWVERLGKEFIVLCPSYPMGAWWAKPAEDLVLNLIQKVQASYPVDTNRIFLAGLSNGAIGAYMIGMFYPDYFAGIIPIASAITPRYMHFLVNLRNTPVYIIQGVHDPIFPIQLTRQVHKILTDMKYPVIYREHDKKGAAHGGHFLPADEIGPMVNWIKQQKRQPLPQTVRMTREANHLDRVYWVRLSKGVQLAALQIPGPEKEPMQLRDGKIATLFAVQKGDNEIQVMGKNILEFEVFLNSEMVDFDAPVKITTQDMREEGNKIIAGEKQLRYSGKVEKDLGTLLRSFKENRDPAMLFDAKVTVSLEKTLASRF